VVGFLVIYISASASWLATLLASPLLGALLNIPAAYGFLQLTRDFERWSRDRRRASYVLSALVSRGVAAAVVALSLGAALLLTTPLDAGVARLWLYATWSGLWILYYCALLGRLEDLGEPPGRYPLSITALGASILLSPVLTEGLPAPLDVKLALAVSMYAGYMPPFNVSALLAAALSQR
jgi:hypothetical protein